MGLWEELKNALARTRNEAGKAAAKAAARQTLQQAKDRVAAVGDGLLSGLEEDLERAEESREGRVGPAPYAGEMDEIEARIKGMASEAEGGAREDDPEIHPEDAAKAELERLKKELLGRS